MIVRDREQPDDGTARATGLAMRYTTLERRADPPSSGVIRLVNLPGRPSLPTGMSGLRPVDV
jgi:hypothetical protein